MRYFFVNLGKYYKEQRQGKFLWAPIYNGRGQRVSHWENMQLINKGDIIFCNNNAHIVSVGIAKSSAYLSDIPVEFHNAWSIKGRRVDMEFVDLEQPFRFFSHKDYILKNIDMHENPFDVRGKAKQGYLFLLDSRIACYFIEQMKEVRVFLMLHQKQNEIENDWEEEKEERQQLEKIHNGSVTGYSVEQLEKKIRERYHYSSSNTTSGKMSSRLETDSKLKATRLEYAQFLCEVDPMHQTFLNATGIHQYMECHHLIPMKAQKNFQNINLDHIYNLISVCPICHRKVHYASLEVKREIFFKMYEIREKELFKIGFTRDRMNSIFEQYYC